MKAPATKTPARSPRPHRAAPALKTPSAKPSAGEPPAKPKAGQPQAKPLAAAKPPAAKASASKQPSSRQPPSTQPRAQAPAAARPAPASGGRRDAAVRSATPSRPAALAKPVIADRSNGASTKRPADAPGTARKAAHAANSPPTASAAPKPTPAPGAAGRPAAAPTPPATDAAKDRASKKPKPPAKTMRVPAPPTEILLKRELPDVRRIASAAMLSDSARGIASPSPASRLRDSEHDEEPAVDASLIATSLASDTQPKIEDNYDYSVLDEFARSSWCPSPTRMVNTGCGGGESAVFFAKRGFSVVGIDSDRTAVGLARERAWLGTVEIDFMVGDLFETPNLLPAESFGLAVDRGAFYRLADDRDRQRYLANIRRLLFQGGVFYLSAGFFPLPEGYEKPKSKKAAPKILLVREGGVVVSEVRQAGFELLHRVLRPTSDSGEYGELLLSMRK